MPNPQTAAFMGIEFPKWFTQTIAILLVGGLAVWRAENYFSGLKHANVLQDQRLLLLEEQAKATDRRAERQESQYDRMLETLTRISTSLSVIEDRYDRGDLP